MYRFLLSSFYYLVKFQVETGSPFFMIWALSAINISHKINSMYLKNTLHLDFLFSKSKLVTVFLMQSINNTFERLMELRYLGFLVVVKIMSLCRY